MADAEVVAEEVQAPADDPQNEETAPVEAESVLDAEPVTDAEESSVLDELDEPAVTTPEPSPEPERLSREQVLEQYGDVINDERNTAVQQHDAQVRRESGNVEATTAAVKAAAEAAGLPVEHEQAGLFYKNAFDNARLGVFSQIGEGAIESLGVDGAEREALRAAINHTDPAMQYQGAQQLVALVEERRGVPRGQQMVYDMTIDDAVAAQPDSTLAKSVRDRDDRKATADAKADGLEGKPTRKRPPGHSVGEPVGTTEQHDLNTIIGVTHAARAGQITQADGAKRLAEIKRGVVRAS